MENSSKVCIAWKNLHCQKNGKVILQNISGCLYYGTLNGLIGPSGSGKSTLFNILNQSLTSKLKSPKSAKVYLDKSNFKRCIYIGQHISQEANVFQQLKVGEILRYAYKFKNGGHLGDEEKMKEHIKLVISQLMLHADLLKRPYSVCSGGEQKRISIATELMSLVKPSLLLLDEATTGLDSASAFEVMQCLKNLTINNRISAMSVFVSIHLPNSAILSIFNQLIVLARGGTCIYSGPSSNLKQYSKEIRLTEKQKQVQPIESLLKVAFSASDDPLFVNLVHQATFSCDMFVSDALHKDPQLRPIEIKRHLPDKWFTLRDLYYHTSRQCRLLFIANYSTLLWQMALSSTIVILLSSIFSWQTNHFAVEPDGCTSLLTNVTCLAKLNTNSLLTENINYLHFLLMTISFQIACTSPALFHPLLQNCIEREVKNYWYSLSVFCISTTAVAVIHLTITTLIVTTLGYFLSGQYLIDPMNINWFRFLSFFLVIWLISLYSYCIGELVSCLFPHSLEVATIASQLMICFCTILNGFFFMIEEMNSPVLLKLADLVAFKYISRYLLYIFYGIDRCDSETQFSLVLEKHYVDEDLVPMFITRILLNLLIIKLFTWLYLYAQIFISSNFKITFTTPMTTKPKKSHCPSISLSFSDEKKSIYSTNATNNLKLILSWRSLSLFNYKPFLKTPSTATEKRIILNNINCDFAFGKMNAILGMSGSGKTSLLRVLNGQQKSQVSPESRCYISSSMPIRSCFIAQHVERHLLPGLTAIQSLLYVSQLKNNSYSESEHMKSALAVLDELNLTDVADTKVNHCSGGEQKRLALALELISLEKMPNVWVLDEPTSGLDSHSSLIVVSCLKSIAHHYNTTVIASIHQPNSEVLFMFDQLYVLAKGGHCIFSGFPESITQHLSLALKTDFTAIENTTPIEMLIEYSCRGIENKIVKKLVQHQQQKMIPETKLLENQLILGEVLPNRVRFSPSSTIILLSRYLTYVRGYLWFEIIAFSCIYLGYAVALQFFFDASIALPSGCLDMESDFNNTCSRTPQMEVDERLLENNFKYNIFTNNIFQFIVLIHTAITFGQEMAYFVSEHQNGWYSSGSFYLSKSIFEFFPMIPVILLYVAIIGHSSPPNLYWHLVLLFTLSTIGFQGLAHCFGILFQGQTLLLMICSSGAFVFLVMLGNFFISLQRLHYIYRFLANGSLARFSFEALILLQYGFGRCSEKEIQPFLYLMQIDDNHYRTCLLLMIANIIITRIVALCLLINISKSSDEDSQRKRKINTDENQSSVNSFKANWLKF